MKLATLKSSTPDGDLVVVSSDLSCARRVAEIAPTMQSALDRWAEVEGKLRAAAAALEAGPTGDTFAFEPAKVMSPLPRSGSYQPLA